MIEKYLQRVQMRKMAQSPGSTTFPSGAQPYRSKYWNNPVTEPTPTPEYLKPKNDYSPRQAAWDVVKPGLIGAGAGTVAGGVIWQDPNVAGGVGLMGGAGGAGYGLGRMINRGLWQLGTVPYAVGHMIDAKRYSNTLDKKIEKARDRILREQWTGNQ